VLQGTEFELLQSVSEKITACAVRACVELYYTGWCKSHLPLDM